MADVTVKYKNATIAELSADGTKTLKTSGKYCEGDITVAYKKPESEPAVVNCKAYDITLAKSSGFVKLLTLESDVLSHINDATFKVMLSINSDYSYLGYSGCSYMACNTPIGKAGNYYAYGYSNRQVTETSHAVQPIYYAPNNTGTSDSLGGYGMFRLNGSDYYLKPSDGFIRGGNYRIVFTW